VNEPVSPGDLFSQPWRRRFPPRRPRPPPV